MLLKPSVNVENIMKLADFIESGEVPWNYFSSCTCYMGQAAALNGNRRDRGSAIKVSEFLGLSETAAITLCYFTRNAGDRSEAVSILRELAATGKLPTEGE